MRAAVAAADQSATPDRPGSRRDAPLTALELGVLGLLLAWVMVFSLLEWPALFVRAFVSNSAIDSAFFAYAGELLRNGGTPYLSYWDHKPPLIHLINAAALTVSGGRLWGIWIVSLAASIAAVLLGYRVLRRSLGIAAAMFGVTYFALALTAIPAFNLTEWYVLPIQWAMMLVLLRHNVDAPAANKIIAGLALGVLAALGFFLRANLIGAAVSAALVLTIVLLSRRQVRAWVQWLLGGIAGFATVSAVLLLYLALEGSLSAFWEQAFRYNFLYSAASWGARIRAGYQGLEWATLRAPLLVPLAGWLLAAFRLTKSGRSDSHYTVLLVAILWFPVELLLAATSGRAYAHYFTTLFPPLAFLAAFLAAELTNRAEQGTSRNLASGGAPVLLAIAIALSVPTVLVTARRFSERGDARERADQLTPTVAYVRENSAPDDRILVWGHAADVYFFSKRRPASRFIYPLPLLTPGYSSPALVREFLDEIRVSAPELIIDAPGDPAAGEDLVPSLSAWDPEWRYPDPRRQQWNQPSWWAMPSEMKAFYDLVSEHYVLQGTVGPQRWRVYRRLATSQQASSAN